MNSADINVLDSFIIGGDAYALIGKGHSYCDGDYFTLVRHKDHVVSTISYKKDDFDNLDIDTGSSRFVSPKNLVEKISDYIDHPVTLVGFSFESDPEYYDDMDETELAQTVLLYDGFQYLEIVIARDVDVDYCSEEVDDLDLPSIHVRKYRKYEDTKFYAMENEEFDGFAYKLYKPEGIGEITPYVMSRGDIVYASIDHDLNFTPTMETKDPVGISMGPIKLIFLGSNGDTYTFCTGVIFDKWEHNEWLADLQFR